MKHLIISEYGTFLGIDSGRLLVKHKEEKSFYPLNRLSILSIAKRGVSISSDLIEALSMRGIKLFFLDFRGVAHSALLGNAQHGVVAIRKAQMKYCESNDLILVKQIITGKIKNQRATLNYFDKYHKQESLQKTTKILSANIEKIPTMTHLNQLVGLEGTSANSYFNALIQAKLLSSSFKNREGRGSQEINNSLFNFGYAILSSYILSAIINAGLEPYLGVIHRERSGKMSLVFDLMEEYRAWVVDRSVIKMRAKIEGKTDLDSALKKIFINQIQKTCSKSYPYRKKKVKLEHIIQRQIYRFSGHLYGESKYKPYLFKW